MKQSKYSVFDDNGKIAQNMTLDIAGTLVYALCKSKWQKEDVTTIIIAREPVREEAWEDDD
jgi:hypothetical protein